MKIKDIVKIKGGKRLPKGENLQTIPNQHPYIRVRDMKGKYISLNELEYVPDNVFPQIRNYIVNENDVIISIVGTIGLVSIIDKKLDKASQSENCAKLSGLDYIDAQYLYYYLISDFGQEEIRKVTVGAVQPKLPLYGIENIEIDWKTRNERINIIFILESLDKKIELNTQINQTLEQIAQTIFKSWFIDFDPVHAKANALASGQTTEQATQAAMAVISGKNTQELHRLQTANPEQYQQLWEIAEAFPSGFDEEGVPRGWIRGNIGAITKAKRLKVGCVDAIVLSAVSSSELIRSDELFTKQVYSKSIEKYLQVHLWDFAYNPSRINIGSIGLLKENIIGAVSPVYEVFSVKEKYHWFLEKILSLEYTKKYIQTLASGSVRQSLKLSELQTIPCVIPNEFIMDLFNSYYISFLDYITNNEKQNTTLSNIRDELLPKLLSGELD